MNIEVRAPLDESNLERVLAVAAAREAASVLKLSYTGYRNWDDTSERLVEFPRFAVVTAHWNGQDPTIAVMVKPAVTNA